MAKIFIATFILFVVMIAVPCYSASDDGNELLAQCNAAVDRDTSNAEKILSGGFCVGFVQGITQMNQYYEMHSRKDAVFCTPQGGITNEKAERIVLKYLNEHPEELHEHKIILAIKAFVKALPCK